MKVRVASAGTGKTTSLVFRYLELIASGTPMRRIAGVTFTRKAADELRQRVGESVRTMLRERHYLDKPLPEGARSAFEEALRELDGATITTIHGFMIEALRLVAPMMGLDPDFRVLGEWEAEALFEEELKTVLYLADSPSQALFHAKAQLGAEAEALVMQLFGWRSLTERFAADEHPANQALQALFDAAYKRYETRLGATLLPPGEVERRALRLARTSPALSRLLTRYRIVLVDEFQDVNPLQGQFFERLEHSGLAVEVVGDPKQSIYGFRNADVEVFRRALARGDVLPPLTETRRHARVVARFLNGLTTTLASQGMGFGPDEAPEVHPAGPQAEVQGRVELHWVVGEEPIDKLRRFEARVLVERLRALHGKGFSYSDMAVLARAYNGLSAVEEALQEAGLPYILLQGRGYFERLEVRDLYHALRVGVSPRGLSLGAFLRSPFAQLSLAEVDAVLEADAPLDALRAAHPEVYARLELIRERLRATPVQALKFLIREPFIGGRRYVDFLDTRARENVDALLFTVAEAPPGDLELLLDRLELLSRQRDAGDVPQSGEGVQLVTVHRAKGLEWKVVAVFDLGRMAYHPPQSVYLTPSGSAVHHKDAPGFEAAKGAVKARELDESYRLLYVAASRARDVLVMTGSVKSGKPDGWVRALVAMNLGPSAKPYDRDDFMLQTHAYRPVLPPPSLDVSPFSLKPALYIDRVFTHYPYPPVHSPSRYKSESDEPSEPLPFSDPDEGESLPGRATTVGTLVHYAISQNWSASNPLHLENLRAQEVMFPFSVDEQQDILQEVKELLANYESLLGTRLPALVERDEDHAELPMALPHGPTVWQGIIDRLYRVGETWYLEDYKTDHEVNPERYHFQLAVYLQAIRAVKGVTPQVQLVYLRRGEIVRVPQAALERAFEGAVTL